MTLWPVLLDATALTVAAVLLAALAWAAIQRGAVHRDWRNVRQDRDERQRHLPHWCAAIGAVAGCA